MVGSYVNPRKGFSSKPCRYEYKFTPKEPKITIECPYCCNVGNVVKDEKKMNAKGEKCQMYECKNCRRHFKKMLFRSSLYI